MAEHRATIQWSREGHSFDYLAYSRNHEWRIAEQIVAASAAPAFRGEASQVDPEEAFVAALASCHMLTFLAICSRKGIVVDAYEDSARGYLEKNEQGKLVMTRVLLEPKISFAQEPPSEQELDELHAQSHAECFLANSVRTSIEVLHTAGRGSQGS